jgi:hypothetical protein
MSDSLYVPPSRTMPAELRRAHADLLESVVRRRPRWPSKFSLLALAGTMVVGTGVATAVVRRGEVTDTSVARCYSQAVRDDGRGFPGGEVVGVEPFDPKSPEKRPGAPSAASALELCSQWWREGQAARVKGKPFVLPADLQPVPALVVCVLPNGQAAVYPGDSQTGARLELDAARG